MAWTAPMTAVANAIFTASQFNTYVRDNLLETAPAKATTSGSIFVATGANAISQRTPATATNLTTGTTTSTTFTPTLTGSTGSNPAVTVTTGTTALVTISAHMSASYASASTSTLWSLLSFAVSGASTMAATEDWGFSFRQTYPIPSTSTSFEGQPVNGCQTTLVTGLTAGSNTFTLQYATGGSAQARASFQRRQIIVIPF